METVKLTTKIVKSYRLCHVLSQNGISKRTLEIQNKRNRLCHALSQNGISRRTLEIKSQKLDIIR